MPLRRRPPNQVPVEEAIERDRLARLGQQVSRLTEQFAMLMANQNTFRPLDSSSDGDKEGSKEDLVPQPRRRARACEDSQRWKLGMQTKISKFHGDLSPEEFLDWLRDVEEILEFKKVPTNARVALVATRLRGRAAAWWQQLKLSRTRMGKSKITDWEKMTQKLRAQFLPLNFQKLSYCGGRRSQIVDVVKLFDPGTVSEAHRRALQVEKTVTHREDCHT